jgi:threonine dehydrogenase-like Zn-dependent dehydrogenase
MWQGKHFYNDLRDWHEFDWGEHGHEISGTVVETGTEVIGIDIGDPIAALPMTGWQQYLLAPAPTKARPVMQTSVVAKGADLERICFADPLMIAIRHVEAARVYPGDITVVLGQGFIGLLVTQLLRGRHIKVIATDVLSNKLALAAQFGAEAFDASDENWVQTIQEAAGDDVRAVIDCSAHSDCVWHAGDIVGENGTVVIMGATRDEICLHYTPLRRKGIDVRFPATHPFLAPNLQGETRSFWKVAVNMLATNAVETDALISKRAPLSDLQEIFENWNNEWIKVIIEPNTGP